MWQANGRGTSRHNLILHSVTLQGDSTARLETGISQPYGESITSPLTFAFCPNSRKTYYRAALLDGNATVDDIKGSSESGSLDVRQH